MSNGQPPPPTQSLRVEVAFATPGRQRVISLEVPAGTAAAQAVLLSGIAAEFPQEEVAGAPLGVFGHHVPPDFPLADGDRVEIYRPLRADPKAIRRERAAQGLTMSGRRVTRSR